jgi:O-antigen ligase
VAGGAAWQRWHQLSSMASADNPRLLLIQMALPMVRDAGFFGDGPGSFKLIYPTSPYLPHEIYRRTVVTPYKVGTEVSIYSHVHNDYLQYLIEWGWVGGILWALLVGSVVWRGITAYRKGTADRLLTIACLAAIAGVLLHALADWPLQVASLQLDVAVYLAILAGQPCAYC